jgi:hypothetical protein
LTPSPTDECAGAIIREHERHDDGEKPSCAPVITGACPIALPYSRSRESWQVAVLVAFEIAVAVVHAPAAAESLIQFCAKP